VKGPAPAKVAPASKAPARPASRKAPARPARARTTPIVPVIAADEDRSRASVATASAASTPAPSTESEGLSILMVASEAVPFAKTGGLADVAGALPVALGRLGHSVRMAVPRYRGVPVSGEPIASFSLSVGSELFEVRVFEQPVGDRASAWLVDIPALYDRDGLYGSGGHDHPDNPRRYAALARAAFETALHVGFTPDVLHTHDWQGGIAPVYLRTKYATDPGLGRAATVFTIHNIAYKGLCDPGWLPRLDLGWDLLSPQALEYWGHVSLLKAGITFSDMITTVSPRYAQEILTPEFAYGFEGILAGRRGDLAGILNGVDVDTWNPGTDPFLPRPFTADDLAPKRDAKRALLLAYGLPSDEQALATPLVGMVSRMVEQKGLDLIAAASGELPHLGARFVVLGTGEPHFEQMWRTLAARFPDRIGVRVGFDEGLSHLIEGGSDLFLMPSRFEPCGLNQMYSLRYGTLPLVRATGGLDDTVENFNPETLTGNGFKFWEPSGPALVATLRWALGVFGHPDVWQRLQRAGMAGDFSWERSARAYVGVYETALARIGRPRHGGLVRAGA
jgi:starch synthase